MIESENVEMRQDVTQGKCATGDCSLLCTCTKLVSVMASPIAKFVYDELKPEH